MRELKDCLQSILRDTAVALGPNEEGWVTLKQRRETDRSLMQVRIKGVPNTTTVISLGRTSQHPILRAVEGQSWLKICDYLLIDADEERCKVMLVELKSTLQKRPEGLEQLRRSLPIAKYLLAVCEVELQRSWRGQFSYALISEKRTNRLDKQRTRLVPSLDRVEREHYEGIVVSVGVGVQFDFATLTAG